MHKRALGAHWALFNGVGGPGEVVRLSCLVGLEDVRGMLQVSLALEPYQVLLVLLSLVWTNQSVGKDI